MYIFPIYILQDGNDIIATMDNLGISAAGSTTKEALKELSTVYELIKEIQEKDAVECPLQAPF